MPACDPVGIRRDAKWNVPEPELADWRFRSQRFPHGAGLLTGTGVVPEAGFTLHPGDNVRIEIAGIGVLQNPVVEV